MNFDNKKQILAMLTEEISDSCEKLWSLENDEGYNVDRISDSIKLCKEKIEALRKSRRELEDLFAKR